MPNILKINIEPTCHLFFEKKIVCFDVNVKYGTEKSIMRTVYNYQKCWTHDKDDTWIINETVAIAKPDKVCTEFHSQFWAVHRNVSLIE